MRFQELRANTEMSHHDRLESGSIGHAARIGVRDPYGIVGCPETRTNCHYHHIVASESMLPNFREKDVRFKTKYGTNSGNIFQQAAVGVSVQEREEWHFCDFLSERSFSPERSY